ncbi:hypothetical protein PF005_g23979 [Phytophthora fragariae]|uniref:RxLR effector protein n=1 Tax=Phytophthora fragariae TaxID=53985 RepID=A0A6A3S037_9STRA|nr:hypothetical protein PF003_g30049 [Phytophthora fragariae]KAE8935719.1 hypothetical protein PF009_g14346 [Phytophthora fragariae]KAE8981335.1 hypothetical protein PF011_g22061 [Phytophthora fragariae]KAE9078039.1 hypothetical protein PF007_g24020 [Phytophthora fragariae]KAE9078344.1 hypothetical protein PF010_g23164 [Phytophthora fragariae]
MYASRSNAVAMTLPFSLSVSFLQWCSTSWKARVKKSENSTSSPRFLWTSCTSA